MTISHYQKIWHRKWKSVFREQAEDAFVQDGVRYATELLERSRVREILGSFLVQIVDEGSTGRRDADHAFEDDVFGVELLPVNIFVGAVVRTNGGACER